MRFHVSTVQLIPTTPTIIKLTSLSPYHNWTVFTQEPASPGYMRLHCKDKPEVRNVIRAVFHCHGMLAVGGIGIA